MKYKLTKAQLVVLGKIVEGLSNEEIAKDQNVSINTVKTHIKTIYAELDVTTRAQVVGKALRENIIDSST